MNSDEGDPLERLVVDKNQINKERLAKALAPVVGIDESGEVVPLEGFRDLDTAGRITAFLLAQRAALLLDAIDESEYGMSTSELADWAEVSGGTVRHHASDKPFIDKDRQSGNLIIPTHSVGRAIEYLEGKRNP